MTTEKQMWTFYCVTFVVIIFIGILILIPGLLYRSSRCILHFHRNITNYHLVTYKPAPLSNMSRLYLSKLPRKTLVLDMDETLITSVIYHDKYDCSNVHDLACDFKISISAANSVVCVYKRPYVDMFLNITRKWYNIIIYTAAAEYYASPVLDLLDNGRKILKRRFYRHHCIDIFGTRGKFVGIINPDLSSVLIIDNSEIECRLNAENCIKIKSYRRQIQDSALLDLLPLLDALRFTSDVRSILARNSERRDYANILIQECDKFS